MQRGAPEIRTVTLFCGVLLCYHNSTHMIPLIRHRRRRLPILRLWYEKDFLKATTQAGRCVPHAPSQVYSSTSYTLGGAKRSMTREETPGGGQERPKGQSVRESRGRPWLLYTTGKVGGGVSRRKSDTECKDPEIYDI